MDGQTDTSKSQSLTCRGGGAKDAEVKYEDGVGNKTF